MAVGPIKDEVPMTVQGIQSSEVDIPRLGALVAEEVWRMVFGKVLG